MITFLLFVTGLFRSVACWNVGGGSGVCGGADNIGFGGSDCGVGNGGGGFGGSVCGVGVFGSGRDSDGYGGSDCGVSFGGIEYGVGDCSSICDGGRGGECEERRQLKFGKYDFESNLKL